MIEEFPECGFKRNKVSTIGPIGTQSLDIFKAKLAETLKQSTILSVPITWIEVAAGVKNGPNGNFSVYMAVTFVVTTEPDRLSIRAKAVAKLDLIVGEDRDCLVPFNIEIHFGENVQGASRCRIFDLKGANPIYP